MQATGLLSPGAASHSYGTCVLPGPLAILGLTLPVPQASPLDKLLPRQSSCL